MTNEDSLFCRNNQTVLNPERFRNAKAISNRRRRKRFVRGEHSLVSTLYRSIRQDSIQSYNLVRLEGVCLVIEELCVFVSRTARERLNNALVLNVMLLIFPEVQCHWTLLGILMKGFIMYVRSP